ncbi:hypothetical protein SAMN05192574_103188 [Mucilaginibacter gossypiicola]|uniref:Lipocalin-like domain-containing protein n=1 Tax=Mucilaginibacter gossypiicola TaxID=551995 RepID=A0A1H8GL36_9SPHI|nr:hypothetical protein [Mucilaginibacter gossypiicola]SEN44683.1 hypothetical protein SAMN05192574_103188 [Mucilaginibacter gossypiicola]
MKISRNLTCGLSICLLLFLNACSKDKKENVLTKNTSIFGAWYAKTGDSTERHLSFGQTNQFELVDVTFKKDSSILAVYYSGQYGLKGDSLKISISGKAVREGNTMISQEPSDAKFYVNSTYIVDGHSLTLNFKDNESKATKTTFLVARME